MKDISSVMLGELHELVFVGYLQCCVRVAA